MEKWKVQHLFICNGLFYRSQCSTTSTIKVDEKCLMSLPFQSESFPQQHCRNRNYQQNPYAPFGRAQST